MMKFNLLNFQTASMESSLYNYLSSKIGLVKSYIKSKNNRKTITHILRLNNRIFSLGSIKSI